MFIVKLSFSNSFVFKMFSVHFKTKKISNRANATKAEHTKSANTVEPLLSGHSRKRDNWPLDRGGRLIEVHTKITLAWSSFQFIKYKYQLSVEKGKTMMAIIRSITLIKARETITCTDATCLSTQHWLACCTNKLTRFETLFCDRFN